MSIRAKYNRHLIEGSVDTIVEGHTVAYKPYRIFNVCADIPE